MVKQTIQCAIIFAFITRREVGKLGNVDNIIQDSQLLTFVGIPF